MKRRAVTTFVLMLTAGQAAAVLSCLITAGSATYGYPDLTIALSTGCALLLLAAGGHVAGTLLPARVTAPLAALTAYLLMLGVSYAAPAWELLTPGLASFLKHGTVPPWWGMVSSLTFVLAAAALLGLPRWRRTVSVPLLATIAALSGSVVASAAVTSSADAQRLQCRPAGAVQLCLFQVHENLRSPLGRIAADVWQALPAPSRFSAVREAEGDSGADHVLMLPAHLLDAALSVPAQDQAAQLSQLVVASYLQWPCEQLPSEDVADLQEKVGNDLLHAASTATVANVAGDLRALTAAAARCDEPR
jgi:hypothetical protein